jgi:CBS domain-containing protein
MRVSDVMTRGVRTMTPHETIVQAAQAMEALDVGAIPVCDGDRLVGMVTDRDIVLRGVAQGRPVDSTPLSEVMTRQLCWAYDDQPVEEVAEQMSSAQVRRVPVIDHDRHVVGIVSLGDLAVKARDEGSAARTLEDVSEPAQPDRSGQSQAAGAAGGGQTKVG